MVKGFIRRSESLAGYPLLFVSKKSGELRLRMDYRKLNQWAKRNANTIPRISAVFEVMKGEVVFSKFDLKFAYNLVRIRKDDDYKTAFNTKFGYFEHLVMPFNLTNGPAVFQSFVNDIFSEDICKYCHIFENVGGTCTACSHHIEEID